MMAVILPVFTIIVFPLPALLLLAMWAFFAIIDISSAGRRRAFLRTKSNLGFFELRKVYLMMLGQLLVFGPILYFVYGGRIADAMTAATQESVARSLTPYVLPTAIIYVLAALVVLMALPYASAMRSLTRISTWPVTPADPKAALTGIGGAILAIAVFLGFVRGVFWLAESFPKIMTIVTSIFSLIGIGAICTGAIPELVRRLRDWFRFRELRGTVPISRVQIARSLDEFRTGPGRLFYVRWLLSKAPELDEALSNPDDEWPDHNRPNYDNDEASALLAKLEERWLGLAR
jgi:hypothetical protein